MDYKKQIIEYQKQAIIEATKSTNDNELVNLIYGLLMNAEQVKYSSVS